VDFEALVCPLFLLFDHSVHAIFNKSVEKFVEKSTPDYGKIKTMNGF